MNENEQKDETPRNRFRVVNVEKTDAPTGLEGNNWYQYEIRCAGSNLYGKRSGTLKQVTEHAEAFAEELNNRDQNKGRKRVSGQKR